MTHVTGRNQEKDEESKVGMNFSVTCPSDNNNKKNLFLDYE